MNPRNFFSELKRRNVYKVAITYAVVGWLVMQVAATVVPALHLSDTITSAVVLLTLLGFPIALVLAWAFELTPEGIKRTEDVAPNESITPRTGRKLVGITIALAVIAAGWFAFQLLRQRSAAVPAPTSAPIAAVAIPEKSIAVLPFENLSEDKANAYFADGIQEEILMRLAKIADLKVISRTSTQQYQSKPGNLSEIAKQLGVANILEGSVQKAGDQVRVNVQLINAQTDSHLWADTYDRKLTDIFGVESEIAKSVAETLQARLTGSSEHVLASRPTEDPEAHQLYLKGRYFWNKRSGENLKKAIDYFQQAIEKDPSYALAYAGLADAYALLPIYIGTPTKDTIPKALAFARKAVELDDSLAEAHISLANVLNTDLQFAAARFEFQKGIALNPNYATAHHWYGEMLEAVGQADAAVAELKRAQELDPLSVIINDVLGSVLKTARRYDEAIEQLRKTIEMDPTFYLTHWDLGGVFQAKGALPEAIAEYERATTLDPGPRVLATLGSAYALAGRKEETRKILDHLTTIAQQSYISNYPFALLHLALGNKEEALRLLEKSYLERDFEMANLKIDRSLDPLRGDPRFEKLIERVFSGNP